MADAVMARMRVANGRVVMFMMYSSVAISGNGNVKPVAKANEDWQQKFDDGMDLFTLMAAKT
jgi:hypothetical protein